MSYHKFHISGPRWVKFDLDLHMMVLKVYENRCNERHTALKGVNKILLCFLHFTSNLDIVH